MKSCDEMVNDLIMKKDEYYTEKKRKRMKAIRIAAPLSCICIITILSMLIWQGGMFEREPTETNDPESNTVNTGTSEIYSDMLGLVKYNGKTYIQSYEDTSRDELKLLLKKNLGDITQFDGTYKNSEVGGELYTLENRKDALCAKLNNGGYVLLTEVYKIFDTSDGSNAEFAGDMHRPEGYSENIGSALAIKLSISTDNTHEYPVIVSVRGELNDLVKTIKNANKSESIINPIDIGKRQHTNIVAVFSEKPAVKLTKFCFFLTADQIIALAESGAECLYIGSGVGNYENMNWDTVEGMDTYCEIHGDMYVFNADSIQPSPDIGISSN